MLPWHSIEERIKGLIARALRADILVGTTASGFGEQAQGHVREDDQPDTPDSVQRGGHYPFFGRAPSGSEVVVAALGGSKNSLITLASRTPKVAVSLPAEGDAQIETTHGQKIQLLSDQKLAMSAPSDASMTAGGEAYVTASGNVRISASSPQKVIVNGGSTPVAGQGHGVKAGELRSETETDGTIDTIKVYFVSFDPDDPDYGVNKKFLEFNLPAGSATFPAAGDSKTISLRGVILEGFARFVGG